MLPGAARSRVQDPDLSQNNQESPRPTLPFERQIRELEERITISLQRLEYLEYLVAQ